MMANPPMLVTYLSSFLPRHQPYMARGNYARELLTSATFPAAMAMLEGGVVGVLAKLVFEVSDMGFATILAAPMFANLTSLAWTRLARGRSKVRLLCTLQSMVLLLIAAVAVLPSNAMGGTMLVALVVVARCIVAGMVMVRSVMWRANYRRVGRAQITGRFLLVAMLGLAIAPLAGYKLLDLNPQWFRLVYPAAALVGLVGVVSMSRVRVRREKQLLDFERRHADAGLGENDDTPLQANGQPHNFVSVLREDHSFRTYMFWMFFAGMANLMGNAAMMLVIVKSSQQASTHKFVFSILLGTSLPMVGVALTVPWWAKLLDRMHITQYRTVHGLFWIVTQMGNFVAASTGVLGWLVWPRMSQGITMGGGMLAWQLGHNDFADRRLAALYMGIHQTLTGIRGVLGPYLGVLLLAGWRERSVMGFVLPGWGGIGASVFLITTALAIIAWSGFVSLHLKLGTGGLK